MMRTFIPKAVRVFLSTVLLSVVLSPCLQAADDPIDPRINSRKLLAGSSSGIGEPTASDILFVTGANSENKGQLGQYLGEGTITIPIDIKRYFGNKATLLKSKALAEQVTLEFVTYDVDEDAYYNPEVDYVYFNGRKIGQLRGSDGAYYRMSFTINIDEVNIPDSPGDVGRNTLTIQVDVNSGGWLTSIEWVSLLIPAAPPVILAHGINSRKETMQDHIGALIESNLGLPVYSVAWPNHGNNHISDVGELAKAIDVFKKSNKVDHVNIVAHSMGGLRARAYTENAEDVLKVLQLGSPNNGSPFADYITDDIDRKMAEIELSGATEVIKEMNREIVRKEWGRLSQWLGQDIDPYHDEAMRCLRTDFMEEYNSRHHLNPLVEYSVLAGKVTRGGWIWQSGSNAYRAMQVLIDVVDPSLRMEGDMIVSVSSAHTKVTPLNGSPIEDRFAIAWHCGLTDEGASIVVQRMRGKLVEHKTLDDVNRFRGETTNNSKSGNVAKKAATSRKFAAGSSSTSAYMRPKVYREAGFATNEETSSFDFCALQNNNPVKIFISSVDENVSLGGLQIVAPSGFVYNQLGSDLSVTNFDSSAFVSFVPKESGMWRMMFTPTSGSMASALWSAVVTQDSQDGVGKPALNDETVKVGENFVLSVTPSYQDEIVDGVCSVIVRNPLGSYEEFPLQKSAGCYQCKIEATIPGQYTFQVSFLGQSQPMCWTESVIGTAVESSSSLNSDIVSSYVDANGNGLYDNLIVNFTVNTTQVGTYRVLAVLSDTEGREITQGWTSNIVCSTGMQTFSVPFNGYDIYGYGECDGYVVSSVRLLEIGDEYEAVVDEKTNLPVTVEYSYNQFEHSLVGLLPGGDDIAIDDDSNGIWDRLEVTIPIYADDKVAGEYEWSAALYDKEGLLLGIDSGDVDIAVGGNGTQITLSFTADGIVATDLDGPYFVHNLIIWNSAASYLLPGEYLTKPYSIKQWGGIPRHVPRYDFVDKEISVEEGKNIVVTIAGGDEQVACSAQLYLTYNTAAAADINLANGSVDGVVPKGGLKFPLTVSWDAGETGEKTVVIPVTADTAFEANEFFTLQLANPKGMSLGDFRVCTVTIKDVNTKATLADGIKNQTLKPTSSGAGAWCAVEGWNASPAESDCAIFVESPTLLAGKTSTLSFGSIKGSGYLYFSMKFLGEQDSGASFVDVYDGKTKLGTITRSANGDDWYNWQVSLQSSGTHTVSLVFTQGLDTDSRVRVANVMWISSSSSYCTINANAQPSEAGFVSGCGTCTYGTKVSLKATPRPGYDFAGWYYSSSGKLVSSKASLTFTANGSADLVALFRKPPYVRGLAEPASAGKVTGSGPCAVGKKVSLSATANKGFVFEGWYDERDIRLTQAASLSVDNTSKPAKATDTLYVVTNVVSDVTYYARFVTVEEDKASIACSVFGVDLQDVSVMTYHATLPCGVWANWPVVASAHSQTTVKVVGLPSGLKYNAATGSIEGAPTAPSKVDAKTNVAIASPVKITVTTAGKSSKTYHIDLVITPMPDTALGTFNGFVSPYDADQNLYYKGQSIASFTLTTTAAGKITAKTIGPKGTVSFTANYWGSLEDGSYSVMLYAKSGEILLLYLDSEPQYWNGSNHVSGFAIGGSFGSELYYVEAQRSSFLKAGGKFEHQDAVEVAKALQGTYKFEATYVGDYFYEMTESKAKTATLTVTIKDTGAVTVAGTISGTTFKISGTGVLRVYPSTCEAELLVSYPYSKIVNLMLNLWAIKDEETNTVSFDGGIRVNVIQ